MFLFKLPDKFSTNINFQESRTERQIFYQNRAKDNTVKQISAK